MLIVAVTAAFSFGLLAFTGTIILLVSFLIPFLLIAIGYANNVFNSDADQRCLGIRREIGVFLSLLVGAINTVINTGNITELIGIIAEGYFINNLFIGDFDSVEECV